MLLLKLKQIIAQNAHLKEGYEHTRVVVVGGVQTFGVCLYMDLT